MSEAIAILDLEYTAWEGSRERGWSGPNEYREIVEIGLLLLRGPQLGEFLALSLYVKPQRNPLLSDYFRNLTGISQSDVDAGLSLQRAGEILASSLARAGSAEESPIWSFGEDGDILLQNYRLLDAHCPIPDARFRNIRPQLCTALNLPVLGVDSSQLPGALGLEANGRHHRAVDDCRAVALALREASRRGTRLT